MKLLQIRASSVPPEITHSLWGLEKASQQKAADAVQLTGRSNIGG